MIRFLPALILAASGPARATELGIDMNRPVWGGALNEAAVTAIASPRPAWVRVNFVLDAWSGPADATPRGPDQLTWFQAYDRLVDGYLKEGIQVYGLIGAESTGAAGALDSEAWQNQFVSDAALIVDHFKDRVRVYEIFNEPNNWVAPNTPALEPSGFAHLLVSTYQAIKLDHSTDPCWQVTLLAGPVLSLDVTTGAEYLSDTYAAGKASWGWSAMKATHGTYPLDGAAYHLYVNQGASETTATVSAGVTGNLQAYWNAFAAEEGVSTPKRLWVSEIGWRTGAVSEQQQADFMEAALLAVMAFGKVQATFWFSLEDFGVNDQWGLYTGQPYDAAHAKPAAARFASLAATYRSALDALPLPSTVPATLQAGSSGPVTLRMKNAGSAAWVSGGPSAMRLGAGPGCPQAPWKNELAWSGFANGGYFSGATDARAFLGSGVAPGAIADFSFEVGGSLAPGRYLLSARMVQEGIAWFGATQRFEIDVLPAVDGGLDAGPADAGSPDAGSPDAGSIDGGPDAGHPDLPDASTGDGGWIGADGGESDGGAVVDPGSAPNGGEVDPPGALGGCGCGASEGGAGAGLLGLLLALALIGCRPRC